MTTNLKNYISNKKSSNYTIDNILVKINQSGDFGYDLIKSQISEFVSVIPRHLRSKIRQIIIGPNKYMNSKSFSGTYKDGTIFVSTENNDNNILDELVHEAAHAVEEVYAEQIYADRKIEKEFVSKRKILWERLKYKGFEYDLPSFMKVGYCEDLDMFFYKKVGYPLLRTLTSDLFHSPYAVTSIREYFSTGFEKYFLKQEVYQLKKTSKQLYNKLVQINTLEET